MEVLTREKARRYRNVMVIFDDGTKKVMPPYNAFALAEEKEMDLVCVGESTQMPVCKLLNFEKLRYEKAKQEREQKKQQRLNRIDTKEIQITYTIQLNDMKTKAKKIKEFIEDNDVVRIVLRLRGREASMIDLAKQKMQEMIDLCMDFAQIKKAVYIEGRDIKVLLEPKK